MNELADDFGMAEMFDHLTRSRRSMRGFLPTPIEQTLLEKIFDTAAQAPSNSNTQPWELHVVSGAVRERIGKKLVETVGAGVINADFPYNDRYQGKYRERQLEVGLMLYKALGVSREDRVGKQLAFERNLEFFGAPHGVFLFMPDWAEVRVAADMGIYTQNLLLAMHSHGISSCPQTILSYNADLIRAELGVDPGMKLYIGISFGYADTSLAQNQLLPRREPITETVHFHS
ncbi:MAG: nitroreductase [Gammaproteobacteria bacterium]|nr:nitroreductase [Gammaproteobacteria bacterium]